MSTNKGLTLTVIIEAESANYGDGFGNISVLKKMVRGNGNTYTYISRQALRFCMIGQLGWDNTPLGRDIKDKSVVQFSPSATIDKYPEIDLFGYMKTEKGKGADTRPAVVRLSNAISLEPYQADMDYLTNIGLSRRLGVENSIAQREIHHALYSYTVAIDLDRVGVDGTVCVENDEKAKRVCDFLDCVQHLYRDIAARRENLAPVFVIGGLYDRKNPYFENRIEMVNGNLNVDRLKEIIDDDVDTKTNTLVGMLSGSFKNESEIREKLAPVRVGEFFGVLSEKAKAVYHES